jgi:phage tail protein X
MGEDPSTIRAEIEETRERMGDTVDALAYKADVKTRAKESVSDKVDSLKSKVTGAKDSVTESVVGAKDSVAGGVGGARDSVAGATPSAGQVKHQTRRAVGIAQENPLGLAIGAAAIGFVAGMLVPSTRVEDEKIGPVADQVKEKAAETGQQALERGKQVAQDVAQQAAETAKESGREQAQGAASDVQDAARETREQVASS